MARSVSSSIWAAVLLCGGVIAGFVAGWTHPRWTPAWARLQLESWVQDETPVPRLDSSRPETAPPRTPAPAAKPETPREMPAVRLASDDLVRQAGIETAAAAAIRHAHYLVANAETAYDTRRYATVSPRVAGFLREVRVDLGNRVHRGDVLAVVDSAEISAARTQYLSAESTLRLATATYERTASLAKTGELAIRAELETRTALDQARAAFLDAEQRLRNFGIPEAELARPQPAKSTASLLDVAAPIDGAVVSFRAVQGEAVQAVAPLFTIADTSSMWLWIDVYEGEIAQVRAGQVVEFQGAGSEPPASLGKVTWMGTEVNPTTRTTRIRAELANPDGRLRANQFGKASIRVGEMHSAVVVPAAAVQRIDQEEIVFLSRSGSTFEPRRVHTRPMEGSDKVEIVAGLEPGARVVAAGAFRLKSELERDSIAEE